MRTATRTASLPAADDASSTPPDHEANPRRQARLRLLSCLRCSSLSAPPSPCSRRQHRPRSSGPAGSGPPAVQRRRRRFHGRHDSPPRAGRVDRRVGAVARRACRTSPVLCERMVVAQRDEIAFMRNWLRDRGQLVPAADATHHRMKMNGVEHDMLMPGMLTPRGARAARQGERHRVGSAVPDLHDSPPRGRPQDGGRAVRLVRRAAG